MWRYLLLLITSTLVLGGCNSNLVKNDQAVIADDVDSLVYDEDWDVENNLASVPPTAATSDIAIWQQLIAGYQLEDIDNPLIDREIQQFTRRTTSLQRQLGLARPYLYYLLQEVEERRMPTELALLPGIESGFRGNVYSRHGAAGLWQFMPATGEYFGLRQDAWYDARKDFPRATEAALLYLNKLHKRFDDDWLLAIAAYNAGGGTVARAIRKNLAQGKDTDFWSLDLPAETETYVPRLLALARVVGHAEHYGMQLPVIDNQAHFTTVHIPRQLDLKTAAQLADMTTDELLELNPGFKRWATHPELKHDLVLPVEKAAGFREKLALLPADQWVRIRRHHIVPGDNLGRIARKYGVSINDLKRANKLPNSNIRAGDFLTIPAAESIQLASNNGSKPTPQNRKIKYQVVSGDSLYRIARQFSVQVSDLKKWNSLNGSYIKPGQQLTVLVKHPSQTL